YRHLQEIESFAVGQAFFADLMALGKTQTIIYAGPNSNQAAGGLGGYKKLRKFHDQMDNVQFSAELQLTLQASAHDVRWLAQELYSTTLPTWQGTSVPSPFRSPQLPPSLPLGPGAKKPLPPTPIDQAIAKI